MESTFAGFQPAQENWSRLPHQLIAALPMFRSLAELKVVLYVLRHTWGFQEYDDGRRISLDEFTHGRKTREGKRLDDGAGMNKQAIIDGIRRAVKHGFLQVEDEGKKGRREKFYKLAMCPIPDESAGASVKIIPGQYENHTSASVKIIPATASEGAPADSPQSPKDIRERNIERKEDSAPDGASAPSNETPATPPNYSWQRTADYTGIAHLVQSGHKRPACGAKPWRYPIPLGDTKSAWAGWRPCPECLKASKKPAPLSPQPHIAVIEAYIEAVAMPLPAAFKMGSFARLGKQLLEAGESASTLMEAGNLVRAWMSSFPALPVLTWEVGETTDMIRRALALCQQGVGPADIQAFVNDRRKESFWRGKLISFAHAADNVAVWKHDHDDRDEADSGDSYGRAITSESKEFASLPPAEQDKIRRHEILARQRAAQNEFEMEIRRQRQHG